MTRKGNTVLAAALIRYGKKIQKYIQKCLAKNLTVKILVEDERDSSQKTSGAISIEIEIEKPGGWGDSNIIEIHGTVGLEKAGKPGKKEDEAYLDGVTVGDWSEGSKAIGLNSCSVGEFLTHMFTLFAIKAGNESILLDNAAGPRGEYIYRQVGFIKSKGDRAQYGDDNEMIFPLTGKKKNKDAGQLWRERYNKFRKKLKTKIKALEAPGPVHTIARGSKRKTRKKRGGNGKDNKTKKKETKCAGIRNIFGVCIKAANKTAVFNKGVIDAQDTSLGQFKTDNATTLMGFPSGKGGGRVKKGGLLGPRELEEGRQYLYNGPEPHFMPQAELHIPISITVTYRGRNVQGLTPNQNYFDGEREIARDGHSLDIFSLDAEEIRQHIQPWFQNPGPSRVTNPSGVYLQRPRQESMCENCTIMGGRKRKTRIKRGGINEPNQNIYYIIQNNAENIRRFQEQVFSPDANAEDAEGFDNLIELLRFVLENAEDAGGFWIVEYSLTRELDANYHHYHLAWENDIPNINDNPDLVNAIRFINGEQNGGRKRRKKKTRIKRGGVKWRPVIIRGTQYAVKMPLETNDQGFIYLYEFEDGVRGGIVAMFKPPTNPQDGESKRQFVEE